MKCRVKLLMMVSVALLYAGPVYCWGFFAHQKINYYCGVPPSAGNDGLL